MKRRPARRFKRARVYLWMLRQNAGAMLKPSPVLAEVPPVGSHALACKTTTGRELLDDDSWVQEAFAPELRQEADHLAATLADLGEPADVRVIMFFV